MSGLWEEVKTRKIFKAATIYAAITWGIIQIADILLPVLGISDWVMSSMVLVAFSGFPLALIVGWALDMKHEHKNKIKGNDGDAASVSFRSRAVEFVVITGFSVGAAYLYYNSASEPAQASIIEPNNIQQLVSPVTQQKTIAVLPFANFSDSNEDEYFADGLSEELLNVLARNKKLRVAARTSSFEYKNTNINVKKIAGELGVQYILEGSVRRAGDVIRVTAQLIKADEDVHVFSKTWDRNTTDIFKVQDEIAQSVLDELKISLLGETEQQHSEIGTQSIAAFAEYSRGLAFLRNRSKSDFEDAIVHFNKALKVDPNYAEAMAMLAEAHLLKVSYGIIKTDEAVKIAKPLVIKALELSPELGSAHAVKGLMHWQLSGQDMMAEGHHDLREKELSFAKQHLKKAITLNPSLAEAYMWYGSILQQQGDFTDGADLHLKAYEIDPRAAIVGYNRAQDLIRYGDYKQAMDVFNTVIRNNPNYPRAYAIAGDVSYAVGQLDQAYNMYNRLSSLSDDNTQWLVNSSRIFLPMGQFQLAQNNYEQLKDTKSGHYNEKFDWLQATIWLASKDYQAFYLWTDTFKESTDKWRQRMWRGFASMKLEKWQFAIDDFNKALELVKQNNHKRVDSQTIRLQLFLARSYQAIGNQLKSSQFLSLAATEIEKLKLQGFDSKELGYQRAALAAAKGEQQQALALLRQSVQEGFVDFWWIEADPIFYRLVQDPAFGIIRDEFNIRMKLMQNNIESQYGQLALGN